MIKPSRIVAKVILLAPDGQTLLLRRSKTDNRRPLQWDLAGGAVEEGEDFETGAARETLEEAGIIVDPKLLFLSYTMADNTDKGNVCWLFFVYQLDEKPAVVLSEEHDKFIWLPIDDAIKQLNYERQQIALAHIHKYVLG